MFLDAETLKVFYIGCRKCETVNKVPPVNFEEHAGIYDFLCQSCGASYSIHECQDINPEIAPHYELYILSAVINGEPFYSHIDTF